MMKISTFFQKKYLPLWIAGFALVLLYVVLRLWVFDHDPVVPVLLSVENAYLFVIERAANLILMLLGESVRFENHSLVLNNMAVAGFIPEVRLKKWMLIFFFLIIITRTSAARKVLFSGILLLVHFFVVSVYSVCGAVLACKVNPGFYLLSIPITIGLMLLVTVMFIWLRDNRDTIAAPLSKLKINIGLFRNGYIVLIITYICLIFSTFIFNVFEFKLWINFLFTSAHKILLLFGYDSVVEPFRLVGPNGSVAMIKACLGFQTMLLFTVMILLTGNNNRLRWWYIAAGLVFFNIVNILRFVFIFIHLQKHGDYLLTMEIHDMYNLITFSIVFILWVIWFEFFADARGKTA